MSWRDVTFAAARPAMRLPPHPRVAVRPHPLKPGGARGAITPRSRDRRRARAIRTLAACSSRRLPARRRSGLVLPGDPGWDDARSAFNLLLDQHPAAVALPDRRAGRRGGGRLRPRAGLRVAPQATAHNQGPLGDLEDTLLLNVSGAPGGPRRPRGPARPGRRRRQVGARRAAALGPRPGGPARLVARRRDRRVLARGRHGLAVAQVRAAGQRRDRARARHRRRQPRARGRRAPPGPLLGAARRRRQLRRRDRDRVRGPAGRRALRRRDVLPVRALVGGAARMERAAAHAARRADVVGVADALPADPRRAGVRPRALVRRS